MDLNFYCQFNETGIGRHCANVFAAISRCKPVDWNIHYLDAGDKESMQRLMAQVQPQIDHTIFFWRMELDLLGQMQGCKIGWLFFESDRLPDIWLRQMDAFDQLWMPTDWGRDILLAHGLSENKIRVVSCGVNEGVFFPQPIAHDGFVFLMVAKYEKRKSIGETIVAFSEEFPAAMWPKLALWLKVDNFQVPARVTRLRELCAHDSRIRIISGVLTDQAMASLYNSADAFVMPTKAEGFGLPTIEALA